MLEEIWLTSVWWDCELLSAMRMGNRVTWMLREKHLHANDE